jgi:hypothetical protein
MRIAIIATGTAASILALATAANAQEKKINIGAQVHVLSDSNVARSDAATAAARGLEREDVIITPSLTADILLPVSRQSVFLRGSIGHDYYQNNEVLSAGRYDLSAGANLDIGLCQGILTGAYHQGQSNLQDVNVTVTENIEKQTTGALEMTCGRAAGLAPTFSLKKIHDTNSAPIVKLSDYDTVVAMVGLAYRRPSLGVVTVFYQNDNTEYTNRLITNGPNLIKDGFDNDTFGISYDRHLGARISGMISIAYTSVKPDSILVNDFQGVTYRGQVDFRVNSRFNTSLRASREATPTIRAGAAYTIADTVQLDATYGLGSRITLNGGLSWIDDQYKGVTLGPNQLKEQSRDSIYGGARWDIGRRFALLFDLRREHSDANVAGLDYTSNQVGLTAIGKF